MDPRLPRQKQQMISTEQMVYLIVNFKFLNHSKLHEHPKGCCYHGVHVKGEVIKMDVAYAKFCHKRDVCCLKLPGDNKKLLRHGLALFLKMNFPQIA